MQFEELREIIDGLLEQVPAGRVELHEAEELAPRFQKIRAEIAFVQLGLELQRNKFKAVSKTQFKNAILTANEKLAAAKEAVAKADPDFLNTVEAMDNLDSRIDYCKALSDVFNNFHIYYRQIAKGD